METQKIVNLLGDGDNECSKFVTTKYYVINDQKIKQKNKRTRRRNKRTKT